MKVSRSKTSLHPRCTRVTSTRQEGGDPKIDQVTKGADSELPDWQPKEKVPKLPSENSVGGVPQRTKERGPKTPVCEGRGPKDPWSVLSRTQVAGRRDATQSPSLHGYFTPVCVGQETPVCRFSQGACVGGRGQARARGCPSARCYRVCPGAGVGGGALVSLVWFQFLPVSLALVGHSKT